MAIFWNESFKTLNLLKLEEDIKEYDKKIEGIPTPKTKNGTPGVTAFELIKRAYESNTLDKLRDFLSVEPQLVTE